MTERLFRSMTPDPDSKRADGPGWRCERCGGIVRSGGWPWCRKGDPKEHER